ncbi:MAG: radical SAM protein [Oscillospiraceae bacterium]|nr:radical SAM protein [Oscillospiraceae bacterium]
MQINRVEFCVAQACTGRCKHCSIGVKDTNEHIRYAKLAGALTRWKSELPIESVMCFGGEPLLYADEVCAIFREAKAAGIAQRQLITNGYFSRDAAKIAEVATQLSDCATEILLSVDAFHQETIPLEPVQQFAKLAKHVRLHPAWLVSAEDDNEWNVRTRQVLAQFGDLAVSNGNVVFPRGNALKYLAEYFPEDAPQTSPYDGAPSLFVAPNGDVFGPQGKLGNAYENSWIG